MRKKASKIANFKEFASSRFYKDEDFKHFRTLIKQFKKKYHISTIDLLNLVQKDTLIPCSIFTKELSPLETLTKYLRENLCLNYSEIADLLSRNRKSIWQAYKNAAKKFPKHFKLKETEYNIPVSVFRTDLSVLESTVVYLKDQFNLSYHQMGQLLQRNERTVWTVYHRAQKKKNKQKRLKKSREIASFQDEDINILRNLLQCLKKRYHLSTIEVLNLTQKEILIPISIFIKELSPLESHVKYLKENLGLDYSKISELLDRNRKTIWQAYKNAAKKFPKHFKLKETEYNIPVSVFRTDLSVLESTVVYLKDQFNLSYHRVGELLQRNERTIWTVYHRALKKRKHASK